MAFEIYFKMSLKANERRFGSSKTRRMLEVYSAISTYGFHICFSAGVSLDRCLDEVLLASRQCKIDIFLQFPTPSCNLDNQGLKTAWGEAIVFKII